VNLVNAYQIIQNVKYLREVDTTKYTFNVLKKREFYFVFLEPVDDPDPKWNRVMAFATEFPEDLSNVMDIYPFANSKGAVEFEYEQ
jgi:hypothetical protein